MNSASVEISNSEGEKVSPLAGTIGAEIKGVDISGGGDDKTFALISQVLRERLVVVIRGACSIDTELLVSFMQRFGDLDAEPFAGSFQLPTVNGNPYVFGFVKEASDRKMNLGGFWHADVTCRPRPHKMGVLYCEEAPTAGGDTMFSNQYLAFESLSDGMKTMLVGLRAVHSSALSYGRKPAFLGAVGKDHAPSSSDGEFSSESYDASANPQVEESVHPVVRTHPDTGRQYLFVNRAFTNRFEHMSQEESRPLLEYLWEHAAPSLPT